MERVRENVRVIEMMVSEQTRLLMVWVEGIWERSCCGEGMVILS
jgi:hypothetical protein